MQIYLSVYKNINISVRLSIYLSIYLSVTLAKYSVSDLLLSLFTWVRLWTTAINTQTFSGREVILGGARSVNVA